MKTEFGVEGVKWKKDRKVKFDFSSNFQLKGWGLCGGSGEDFTNAFGL